MDMTDERLAHPKPEPRKRTKARAKRVHADHVAEVRAYVVGRERNICRCCRFRPLESMHELVFRSLGGKVSRVNSIGACGSGTTGCHGFLQSNQIQWGGDDRRAESTLLFTPTTQRAADHLRIKVGETIVSPLMRECDDDFGSAFTVPPCTDRRAGQ